MQSFLNLPVEVMAVSKTQPVDRIQQLLNQGYRLFGESKVQEASQKWPALLEQYSDCRLHLIGSLQTNKAKQALDFFYGIETIDRPSLVDALVKYRSLSFGKTKEFLIQVNIGCEPQKSGVDLKDFEDLYTYCQTVGLPIHGLMCIPPVNKDPTPFFTELKKLANQYNLKILSMGMSQDYETALKCGSTRIRLGTALFGSR